MKSKYLLILATLALLSAPLAAQLPEDEAQIPDAPVEDVDRELDGDTEVQFDTENQDVDAEAEVKIDDDADLDAEADIDAEFDTDEDELPRTATPLPLLALLGAGSVVSALGLRISRRK
jgi:hypothetical protein